MFELDELLMDEEEPLLQTEQNHHNTSFKVKIKSRAMESGHTSVSTLNSTSPIVTLEERRAQSSNSRSPNSRSSSSRKSPFTVLLQCLCFPVIGIFRFFMACFTSSTEYKPREFRLGKPTTEKFVPNVIKNQKYNIITFIPLVLFQQFKFFLNLYFLVMACSQFFPDVRIGYWYTYWGPLIFVLMVTLIREWVDDFRRMQRDKEINSQKYHKLTRGERAYIPSSSLKVGDLVVIEKDQRIPADIILLRTSDRNGRCFIRTDQLDGETDWKLRIPVLQEVESDIELLKQHSVIYAERPQKDIHSFIGCLYKKGDDDEVIEEVGISLENTLWANTVLAAGEAVGVVVYTGRETRSVMNNSKPRSKVGLIDLEINDLTKILFVAVVGLAFLMMCLKGFEGPWYRYMFRFVLLFSYIIPISLRVNMDMAKSFYAWSIQRDKDIPGTVVRSSTIPEDLGRISYLLTDKTGTLTQNEMVFRRLHLATSQYDSASDVLEKIREGYNQIKSEVSTSDTAPLQKVNEVTRVVEAVKALSLCHNVTPVYEETSPTTHNYEDDEMVVGLERAATLQASSPDEIALVKFSNDAGLLLLKRDQTTITIRQHTGDVKEYTVLHIFPFTSEAKRMGIIVKDPDTGVITFYLKGADTVMKDFVKYNDWMTEAGDDMAREGLRTLAVAKRILTPVQYAEFDRAYSAAKSSKVDRATQINYIMGSIERDMDLLCVTGVEDTLQQDVKVTLETLRNAGIKIWMLTGDKLETATCIAKSSKLISVQQEIYTFKDKPSQDDLDEAGETGDVGEGGERQHAFNELNAYRRKSEAALIIKGETLQVCLKDFEDEFMELACNAPVVVVCRCSPTQKAQVVEFVQKHTGKRAAAIGDGGNDVAMIQAADTGIGIEGKEGRQASLAADFSIPQFSFVSDLLLVHGRYCYKRSASLAQFVMHRGLIITVMQAVFSSIFYFSSVALYQGFLMIGYATVYTMFPVFALVLDKDVKVEDLRRLPELYSELGKGRSLTYKTFFLWVLISVFQGGVIMYGALILFQDEFIHIVSISFTSLILTELIMVALTIRTMHRLMLIAELTSFLFYVATLILFHEYFDSNFILSFGYFWKVVLITTLSCVPIYIGKYIRQFVAPPSYSKLN